MHFEDESWLTRAGRWTTGLAFLATAIGLWVLVSLQNTDLVEDFVAQNAIGAFCWSVIGWIVVKAQPRNGAVWTIIWVATFSAVMVVSNAGVEWSLETAGIPYSEDLSASTVPTGTAVLWWVSNWSWALGLFPMLTLGLLLFPGGRPTGHVSRWLVWWSVLTIGLVVATAAWGFRPTSELAFEAELQEVSRLLPVAVLLMLSAVVLSLGSLVGRAMTSTGVERQQFRWFGLGAGVFSLVLVVGLIVDVILDLRVGVIGIPMLGAVATFSACYGVAVGRYRLYEIDRVVSRTLTYTLVVAVLGGLYSATVTSLTTLLPSQGTIAVATSTLAVAALFNPLRRRVQRIVDRRFNRTAYQAEAISDRFAVRLRDSLSPQQLADLWAETVTESFQPESAGVWLVEGEGG